MLALVILAAQVRFTLAEQVSMAKKNSRKASQQRADAKRVMTILIHGTYDSSADWYQPESPMHDYIMGLFPDDFFELDRRKDFCWAPARPNKWARWRGGEKLLNYCERYRREQGIQSFRLIGHSHGATVASICTHRMQSLGVDWKIERLVFLSPLQLRRWPADHLPSLDRVDGGCFFNLHPQHDPIVNPPRRQNFQDVDHLRSHERETVLDGRLGHWLPTEPWAWRESGFEDAVRRGCDGEQVGHETDMKDAL